MRKAWHSALGGAVVASTVACATVSVSANQGDLTSAQLETSIRTHLERRDPQFSEQIPASEYARVMPAFQAALHTDDYLREDYRASQMEATSTGAAMRVSFRVQYWETKTQYEYVQNRVSSILKTIIQPSMNDLQKEKAIHDYIVLHVTYDTSQTHISPYDALTDGTVVCQGYAMLADLMLHDEQIPVRIVDGTADGQSHAWNLVQIDGRWYNLDVTWDDPVPDQPGKVIYDEFNLTDTQLARDHTWKRAGLPRAQTDFVQWLSAHAKPHTLQASAYQKVLMSTGLYLETPSYTYNDLTTLQAAVNAVHGTRMMFRYPYASLQSDLGLLSVRVGYRVQYQRDPRDPKYAMVSLAFT